MDKIFTKLATTMIHVALAIVAAVVMVIAFPKDANAFECKTVEVETVALDVDAMAVKFDKGFKELTDFQRQSGVNAGVILAAVSGFVHAEREVAVAATKRLAPDVYACKATVRYSIADIYVARELKNMPCARDEVLTHERIHAAIYRDYLAKMAQKWSAMTFTGDSDTIANALQGDLDGVRTLHADHDSPTEYDRMLDVCFKTIPKTIVTVGRREGWIKE